MKIAKADDLVKAVAPDKMQSRPPATQADFGDVLKQTMQTAGSAQDAVQSSTGIEPLLPVQLQRIAAIDKKTIVKGIENVLDLLDDYRSKLADPNIVLKDIHPLISAIEHENKYLKPLLNSLSEGDELKPILNQTLVTTSLEVIKFNKGDYISP